MAHLPVVLALAIAAGTAVGVWHPALQWPGAGIGIVGAILAAWAWYRGRLWLIVPAGTAGITALAACLGAGAFLAASHPPLVAVLEEAGALDGHDPRSRPPLRLEGRLTADAALADRSVLLKLAVERVWIGPCGCPQPVEGHVQLAVAGALGPARVLEWRAGRRVSATATLRRPSSYRNHGLPDAARELIRRRVALMASAKSALQVHTVASGTWVEEAAASVRARARLAIARAAGPDAPEAAAIGTAVLVGDRAGLDPDLTRRLQRAGTFHVIAISGGNIALLTVITLWALSRMTRTRGPALAVAAAVLVAYAGLVGGGASVLRATGMALVAIAARLLDQRGASLNVLAATGALLLLADPLISVDTGFWLTCAATGGMLVGLPRRSGSHSAVLGWTAMVLRASVWAELGLLPIITAAFQQVTLAGLVLNPIAIPGMALAQLASMSAVAVDLVAPRLIALPGLALRLGTAAVVDSASLLQWTPWLAWRVPPPTAATVVAYYAVLATWLWLRAGTAITTRRARRTSTVALAVVVLWVAVEPLSLWRRADGTLTVTTLDVGQGDAILVRFPNGARMLVDAGGTAAGSAFDIGDRVVGPALRARGIRHLDYLVDTHADADHIGGAATVVREFRPAEVWAGVPVADDVATAELRRAADDVGAAWRIVRDGERMSFGAAELFVRHPPPPDWERQRVRNDDSVVLTLTLGAVGVWLTGDIGTEVEHLMADSESTAVAAGASAVASSAAPLTVLKVAHHGSAGSSSAAWLGRIRPAVALVSAGADNPFGHPAPAALDRLAQAGAEVWRTDQEGEVSVRTDGRAVEVSAFSGRRRWLHAQPR